MSYWVLNKSSYLQSVTDLLCESTFRHRQSESKQFFCSFEDSLKCGELMVLGLFKMGCIWGELIVLSRDSPRDIASWLSQSAESLYAEESFFFVSVVIWEGSKASSSSTDEYLSAWSGSNSGSFSTFFGVFCSGAEGEGPSKLYLALSRSLLVDNFGSNIWVASNFGPSPFFVATSVDKFKISMSTNSMIWKKEEKKSIAKLFIAFWT